MKVIVYTSTHLKLLQRSWSLWVQGALYELGGLYLLFRDSTSFKPWIAIAMLIGLGYLLTSKSGTLTCDFYKSQDVMVLTKQGLLDSKTVEYSLQEITAIEVVQFRDKLFIPYYKIRIILKSKVLYLTAQRLNNHGEACNVAHLAAQFLGVSFNYLPTYQ